MPLTARTAAPTGTGRRAPAWALITAVLLAALNLRTAVTSVGPLLDELESGIGLTGVLAGVLTTLPVIAFAVLGSLTPRLAHRVGEQRLLAGALVLMTVGLALRAMVSSPWPFLLLSVLALAGGAMGNVLLPVLVKRHFPDRVGTMTAGYTTSMAIGTTLGAALTVPIATRGGTADWRVGLGAWAVLAAVAAACWVVLPGGPRTVDGERPARVRVPLRGSSTAWSLALFFGSQSLQAYVAFGWFALFFRERAGASATRAGLLVAVLAALSIPVSVVIPSVAARMRSQRPLIALLVACYVVAYSGMLVAPAAGAWIWVVLTGIGSGAFPLALTLIGMRSRTPHTTAALSAFAQSIGYLLAGCGPLLVGVLHGADGGWGKPFALLFGALVVMAVSGWRVGQPRDVEDDVPAPA
jgi:CP family cyanate transporter-like MFS transporter